MVDIRKPIFVVPLALGSIASGNEQAGYPASHLGRHKDAVMTWRSNGAAGVWARGNFGSPQTVDFCALMLTNATASTTIRLRLGDSQAAVDGAASYDSGAQLIRSPAITRPDGLYHSFLELPAAQTRQWWRIDIDGHTGDFEAAFLVLGRKLVPSKFWDFDIEFGLEDQAKGDFTNLGTWDEEPGVKLRTVDMTLNWMSESEWENDFRPMVEMVGTSSPVYCCVGPEDAAHRQARTYFGKFGKPPYARGRRKPRTFGGEFKIISIV